MLKDATHFTSLRIRMAIERQMHADEYRGYVLERRNARSRITRRARFANSGL